MSTRTRAAQVLAATAAVGLLPVALTVAHLPTASTRAVTDVQPASSPTNFATKWVAIQTGATSRITLNDSSGQLGAAQTLAPASNCVMNQGTPSSRYISFTGSTGGSFNESLASYSSGSIGVAEKKSGTSCYRVDSPSESLDLKLGGAFGGKAIATSAFLDLELKQSARILATAKLAGTTVATFELQSGASVGLPPLTSATPDTCTGSADSGPDSGTSDNCRWAISVPSWLGADDGINFDELVLSAHDGSFSLEGGADGSYSPAPLAPADASVIEVSDITLGCNTKTTTITGDGAAPGVYVTRLGNTEGTCQVIPYLLDSGSSGAGVGFAQFLKQLNTQTSAQFVWDVVWNVPQAAYPNGTLPTIKIDYESGSAMSPHTLDWCPGTDGGSTFTGYTATQVAGFADQDDVYLGTQFGCILSRDAHTLADGTLTVHDRVYVYGDAKLSF